MSKTVYKIITFDYKFTQLFLLCTGVTAPINTVLRMLKMPQR